MNTEYATPAEERAIKAERIARRAFAFFLAKHNRLAALALTANALACRGFLPAHVAQCLDIL